ncbi:hypothetical protein OG520_22205 [Streptomyces sp. NBC_00984]|uniref:hypothetical protein n=1 Tax=Streptomyces sp. NBC_00984 TaxID=2903700 RepID=UPI0038684890|nr:hypothetical protein OG520_22205 [Streptomyces sp. NBC_00984]
MADKKPTQTKAPTIPAVGKPLSVRVQDEGMRDDLAVIMRTGCTASDAVRQALYMLANAYYAAWELGGYPPGTVPQITAHQLAPYDARQATDQAV